MALLLFVSTAYCLMAAADSHAGLSAEEAVDNDADAYVRTFLLLPSAQDPDIVGQKSELFLQKVNSTTSCQLSKANPLLKSLLAAAACSYLAYSYFAAAKCTLLFQRYLYDIMVSPNETFIQK